jgi:hypothetical protein
MSKILNYTLAVKFLKRGKGIKEVALTWTGKEIEQERAVAREEEGRRRDEIENMIEVVQT